MTLRVPEDWICPVCGVPLCEGHPEPGSPLPDPDCESCLGKGKGPDRHPCRYCYADDGARLSPLAVAVLVAVIAAALVVLIAAYCGADPDLGFRMPGE